MRLLQTGNIAQEKDRQTLILLLMTDLSNAEIVLGKILASLLQVGTLILASAPVFVIPLTRIVHGHRASWRAWTGALVALLGVALLAARHQLVD